MQETRVTCSSSGWTRPSIFIGIASVVTFLSWPIFAAEPEIESPPFIDNLQIYGDFSSMGTSGARVTAAYSYTDFDGDAESASRYEWFVMPADRPVLNCFENAGCVRVAEPSFGTAERYPVLALGPDVVGTQIAWDMTPFSDWTDLNGMLLEFCVTPNNENENGTTNCTFSSQPLSDIETIHKPYAYQLVVNPSTGITIDSTLLGSYKFGDNQEHSEENSRFRWKNELDVVVSEGISQGSNFGVELTLANVEAPGQVVGHRLRFCIIPRDDYGHEGAIACSLATEVIGGNDNQAPQLRNLRISGDVVMGSEVGGLYQYLDAEMDPENVTAELSSVRWQYRETSSAPWQHAAGSGLSITVENAIGELRFCMTPYATTGTIAGTEMCSPAREIMNGLPDELRILRNRYNSGVSNCGSDSAPAFLCSGLLTKGALPGNYSWETTESNAVSFNYLRRDANFSQLSNGETHGMIFLPIIGTGDDHRPDEFEIYCAFPVTADTGRRDRNGCGQHVNFGSTSDYCYPQGITNLSAWRNHFNSVAENRQQAHQCGFDVYDAINDGSAEHFMLSLQARNAIISSFLTIPNELRIESWLYSSLSEVPIEAFFYSDQTGLSDGQRDQRDYLSATGIWLPLISISLPTNGFSYTKLYYYADEQAVIH